MRERLIELLPKFVRECAEYCTGLDNGCYKCTIEQLADHLLANGVIVPPCKVGDKVYIINEGDECAEPYVLDVTVSAMGYDIGGFWITMDLPLGLKMSAHIGERSLGKTVFLTKEEAEAKLKEGVQG